MEGRFLSVTGDEQDMPPGGGEGPDESRIPTAPMKVIRPEDLVRAARASAETLADPIGDGRPRLGSREQPYTVPEHPEIPLDEEARVRVLAKAPSGPNMALVGLRALLLVIVIVGVLAGVGTGIQKFVLN